ncbi:MAG: hypothetical protein NUW37_05170 [Planctomycetes bacterium]|nr:hypothetical protein [Planctomycetota bacterium]
MRNNYRFAIPLFFACLSMLVSPGCATIISGTTDTVTFDSNLMDAKVEVDGRVYNLPTEVELETHRSYLATFRHPDAGRRSMIVEQEFNWWTLGNIIFWPAFFVDVITGAMWKLEDVVICDFQWIDWHERREGRAGDPDIAWEAEDNERTASFSWND